MNNLALDEQLIFIGVQLAKDTSKKKLHEWIDIEETLYKASFEIPNDSRLFSLLASWILVHGDYVIVEKLMKMQKKKNSPWLVALAICAFNLGFHRFKRLIKKQKGFHFLIDKELTLSMISLKGEEDNFRENGFLIPKSILRLRSADALSPELLVKKNAQYRNRLLFGSSWRADIITMIERGVLTPYRIAKILGCSYEPAHRILKEYSLAMNKN